MVNIKDLLLLIDKSNPWSASSVFLIIWVILNYISDVI